MRSTIASLKMRSGLLLIIFFISISVYTQDTLELQESHPEDFFSN